MHPPGYPPMHHEYMGHQYPYPTHPGPPMSFPGIMQPPLSAIPRGGSAGQSDEPTNDETTSNTSNHEPPKKRRKWSNDGSAEDASAPTAESSGQPQLRQDATPPTNEADTPLDTSLMLGADEAATVVALLQQASGQILSADTVSPAPLSESRHEAETLAQVTSAFIDDTDVDADEDADADGEVDAEGEAEVETDPELSVGASLGHDPPPRPPPLDHILTEDGEPMLNPGRSYFLTYILRALTHFL